MIVQELREGDCYPIVAKERIAHLGCCSGNQPYVVPIYYVYADGKLYSFSMPGRKAEYMRQNPKVCVQIDSFSGQHQWKSIVIDGTFRELTQVDERERGWEILQQHNDWWEPGALKPQEPARILSDRTHFFYTISIDRISGRGSL